MKKNALMIILSLIMLTGVMAGSLSYSSADGIIYGKVAYENGDFDSFFEEDYKLGGFYNGWLSLAGTVVNGSLLKDSYAYVANDGNAVETGNRALKLGYAPMTTIDITGLDYKFNSAFCILKTPLTASSEKITVSFDMKVNHWDKLVPGDRKAWFMMENLNRGFYICDDKTAVGDQGEKYTLSDFPETANKPGYRTVTIETDIIIPVSMPSITFWFFNGGEAEALIDNVSVKKANREFMGEGTFEKVALNNWANPINDPLADPFKQWGVTWGESNSPAVIEHNGGKARLVMRRGQNTFGGGGDEIVNFGLGSKAFLSEGRYELSFDLKLSAGSKPIDSDMLQFRIFEKDSVSNQLRTNILEKGTGLYDMLPESTDGYKHYSYVFHVSAEQADSFDSMEIDFRTTGTEGNNNILYIDNLFIKEALSVPPAVYGENFNFDRASNNDFEILTNVTDRDLTALTGTGQSGAITASDYSFSGNTLKIKAAFLKNIVDDGNYNFTLTTADGSATFTVAVAGENKSPVISAQNIVFNKKKAKDTIIAVDLKGQSFLSIKNFGIALLDTEFSLSEDKTKLTIKSDYLKNLGNGVQTFVLATEGGNISFDIEVQEKKTGCSKGEVLLPLAVCAIFLLKRKI